MCENELWRNYISFGKKYFGEQVLLFSLIYIDFVLLKRVKLKNTLIFN